MSELLTAAEGRRVVSKADAETVGQVHTFIFDERVQRVTALHVSGGKRKAELVDWTDVSGFGPDAVVITDADRLRETADELESEAVRHTVHPMGATVLDDRGDAHGTVRDIRFDPETGAVEAIVGDQGEWTPDDVRSIGTFALVVHRHEP